MRTWKPFELTSTQQTITVPITEKDIPNVYVSVLLVKGRTQQDPGKDGSDPGKPAFRLGYVELKVEDASKRLNVDVKANRDEFRPATKAKIEVNVKDAAGKPSQSEVTLWAVDYGVLSLTGYQTPDVLEHDLSRQGAAGLERRLAPAHRQPPRAHAEGRDRGRRRRTRRRTGHAAQGLPRARVLARLARHRREGPRDDARSRCPSR